MSLAMQSANETKDGESKCIEDNFPQRKTPYKETFGYGPSKINILYKLLAKRKSGKITWIILLFININGNVMKTLSLCPHSHRVSKEKLSEDPIY